MTVPVHYKHQTGRTGYGRLLWHLGAFHPRSRRVHPILLNSTNISLSLYCHRAYQITLAFWFVLTCFFSKTKFKWLWFCIIIFFSVYSSRSPVIFKKTSRLEIQEVFHIESQDHCPPTIWIEAEHLQSAKEILSKAEPDPLCSCNSVKAEMGLWQLFFACKLQTFKRKF